MNCIGSNGKLGNQMFQYATLRSLAKKFNYEYCLPTISERRYVGSNIYDCFKLKGEKREDTDLYKITCNESPSTCNFDANIFNKCPDNVDLDGYFQNVKYFESNREDLKECFTFFDHIFDVAKSYFYGSFGGDEVISLHIRRGDYLNFSHHPVQDVEYYSNALKMFDDNLKVLIFTDDPEWASQQELFQPKRFFFSRNNDDAVDLCMQTFCKYHIIANSTYSWWGAWLSDAKAVVKPKLWFSPPLENNENILMVEGWEIL